MATEALDALRHTTSLTPGGGRLKESREKGSRAGGEREAMNQWRPYWYFFGVNHLVEERQQMRAEMWKKKIKGGEGCQLAGGGGEQQTVDERKVEKE